MTCPEGYSCMTDMNVLIILGSLAIAVAITFAVITIWQQLR